MIFWLIDYAVASIVVFTLSKAGVALFDFPALSYLSLLFIPIATMFFTWQAYRGNRGQAPHRLIVAGLWLGTAVIIDVVVAYIASQVTPFAYLASPIVIAVYGTKFLAVFVGAYLGGAPVRPAVPSAANGTPSPRSV